MNQELLNLNTHLLQLTDVLINSFNERKFNWNNLSAFQQVVCFLFGKACKSYHAIHLLCKGSFGQDAAILVRSLLEILINLFYIAEEESEQRAENFIRYWIIMEKHRLEKCKKRGLLNSIQEENQIIQKYEEEIDRRKKGGIKEKRGKEYKWSGKSIAQMAREVGLDYHHDVIYWRLSQIAHPNIKGSEYFVSDQGNDLKIDCGPGKTHIEESFTTAFDFFSQISLKFNEILLGDTKIKKQLESLRKDFEKIAKRLSETHDS